MHLTAHSAYSPCVAHQHTENVQNHNIVIEAVRDRILGLDQNIEGLKTLEFKGKVDYLIGACSEKGMPEIETQIIDIRNNHHFRP